MKPRWMLACAVILSAGVLASPWAAAQQASILDKDAAAALGAPDIVPDPDQRSYKIYTYEKAATGGPKRGEEIYYYNCFFCHNEYTKAAPKLQGLFQHATLLLGQPVNDDTVKSQIVDGSPGMPAFKYTLSAADISDLMSFLHNCCFDADNPPPNPQYRAN